MLIPLGLKRPNTHASPSILFNKESMAEVTRVQTSQDFWKTLERVYNHYSVERTQNLCDSLCQLNKGNLFVSDYAKKFKSLFDHLQAIGYLVDLISKLTGSYVVLVSLLKYSPLCSVLFTRCLPLSILFLGLKGMISSLFLFMDLPHLSFPLMLNNSPLQDVDLVLEVDMVEVSPVDEDVVIVLLTTI